MVKNMDEQQVQDLMKWAEEVANKCIYSVPYILALHGKKNNEIKDCEKAKVVVANELINGK